MERAFTEQLKLQKRMSPAPNYVPKYQKGIETRRRILQEVNKLYNKEGLNLTLGQIADKLGMTLGSITNYFPRKEQLLLALFRDFDEKSDTLYRRFQNEETLLDFSGVVRYYHQVMDLQYRYRFAMAYLAVQPIGDPELQQHLQERYQENRRNLEKRVAFQVTSGSLKAELLEPATFDIFCFQLYNLLTTWVVSLQLYHRGRGYREMKPVYLRGILSCFTPYLTEKGIVELQEALRQLE